MLKPLLEPVRKYPVLKLLLFFHGIIIAVLVAYYYGQAETALWRSILYVPVGWDAEGGRLYKIIARGPSLLLPWNLLPQHVLWLGLDILVFGSLSIWWTYRMMADELRYQVAGREKAAADKLQEAATQSAAAASRMREAEDREQRLEVRESRLSARESEAVKREMEAQAVVEGKDAEVKKMSTALSRLKTELGELRKRSRA